MRKIANNEELAFDVEFMTCVVDKADNLVVIDSDTHFSDFVGVHPSKIKQGKLFLHDAIMPKEREKIMRQLCKKNSPYVYFDLYLKNKDGDYVYVHCSAHNREDSTLSCLTFADVSRSVEKTEQLRNEANQMNHLIDLVNGGVALFKVDRNMHFNVLYLNEACCKFFGTTKESCKNQAYRIDEVFHPDDRSKVFQAIGNCMATKKPIDIDIRVLTHKDEFIWCKMNSAIQRYDSDNSPIFHAIFTDISQVKKGEQEADRQSDLMVKIFKNLPGPLFCTSIAEPFKFSIVSEDFIKLIGYTRAEFFDKFEGNLSKLMADNEVPLANRAVNEQIKNSNNIKTTYSIKTKDGKNLVVVDKRKIITGDSGEKSTIGILRDITSMRMDDDFDF